MLLFALTLTIAAPVQRVQLIELGQAPRRALRYALPEGSYVAQLDWQIAGAVIRGALQGEEHNGPLLSAILKIQATPKMRSAKLRIELKAATVLARDEHLSNAELELFERAAKQVRGAVWTGEVDTRGRVQLTRSKDESDQMNRRVLEELDRAIRSQLFVPLPEKPVGKGAVWTSRTPTKVGFVPHLIEEKRFTLQQLEADEFHLRYTLSFTLARSTIQVEKEQITINGVTTKGAGRVHRRFDALFPVLADQALETRIVLEPKDVEAEHQRAFLAVFKVREALRQLNARTP